MACTEAAVVGGENDDGLAVQVRRSGHVVFDQVEHLPQIIVDVGDGGVPCTAAPTLVMSDGVGVAVMDECEVVAIGAHAVDEIDLHVGGIELPNALVHIDVDLVSAVVRAGGVGCAVRRVVALFEEDEFALAGVKRGGQAVVMGDVEDAGLVGDVGVALVVQRPVGGWIAVTGVAVVERGVAAGLEYGTACDHAGMVGDGDGVCEVGAGVERRRAFGDKAFEVGVAAVGVVVDEVLEQVRAKAVDADKDDVVDVRVDEGWQQDTYETERDGADLQVEVAA